MSTGAGGVEPGHGSRLVDRIVDVRRAGDSALLVTLTDGDAAAAFHAAVRARWRASESGSGWSVIDAVPAARTVLLDGVRSQSDAEMPDPDALVRDVATWEWEPSEARADSTIELPVRFDGPDLDEVASQWAVAADDVVARMLATSFRVDFCGFAPGFGYLSGLPVEWSVSRRPQPRTSVPAGAVGLAGVYAGIYPRSSPGGWRIVGTAVGVDLWDVHRDPPALLAPGTHVVFVDAEQS